MPDRTPSDRILLLLLLLLRQPYRYTRTQLAERYDVDKQTVKRDLRGFTRVGLEIDVDRQHRYAVLPGAVAPQLKSLQPLSDADLARVKAAIATASTKAGEADVLLRKLESVRDFQRLGLRSLRSPELAKIDALERAIASKLAVRLEDYRSTNTNEVMPRLVEPFELDTSSGILHAYDLGRKAIRHFRIDRFTRVSSLDEPATHRDKHHVQRTDPFRIASDEQVRVHLELDVAARNDLTERFPAAQAYLSEAAEQDRYDFDAQVNARLLGVLPFCMANWRGVRVRAPEELRAAMRAAAAEILAPTTPL